MADDSATELDVSEELQENWAYFVISGMLLILLGSVAAFAPFLTGLTLSVTFGFVLAIAGLVRLANSLSVRGWKGWLWEISMGLFYVFAGFLLVFNPVVGLTSLTVLLIIYFAVEGVVQVLTGFRTDNDLRLWFILSGLVSLILAVLLWTGLPTTTLWVVGFLFGLNLLSTGLSLIVAGNLGRKAAKQQR